MDTLLTNIRDFFTRLSIAQRISLGLVVLLVLVSLISIILFANKSEYSLLFGHLPETTASEVVEVLKTENIEYELRDGGSSIYVPNEHVYDLRLRLAREGIITDGANGYEIFDENMLGMTDFMQKLNMRRALEGELARTISSIDQVSMARIHLVIPERSPFRETQVEPTASVVLDLKSGSRLSPTHIEGIIALVAGAVEGLEPADVNILDSKGNMLSDPDSSNPDLQLTTNQMRMQEEKEIYLTEKAQSLLEQMLGAGNAIIRLNLELDFSRSITENNLIDPESQTVIAEERLQEEAEVENANSSVRNYEVSRTRETVEKSAGEISYLSVSVILNYREMEPAEEAETEQVLYEPIPAEEVANIEMLVKETVGWREDRGDGFAISQIQFDTSMDEQIAQQISDQKRREMIEMGIRYGFMLLGLGLAAWLVKATSNRAKEVIEAQKPALIKAAGRQMSDGSIVEGQARLPGAGGGSGDDELILVEDIYTSKLSPEAKARLKAKQQMLDDLKDSIIENPEEAAGLLRNWIMSDTRKADEIAEQVEE